MFFVVWKAVKLVLKAVLCVVLALALLAGGYVVYLLAQYHRIADGTALAAENNPAARNLARGNTYTALTYNIGFGAYNHDFSFFMDTGAMLDGTPVSGAHARAGSEEAVLANTDGAIGAARAANPDFLLFQEADVKADRSFKVDQTSLLRGAFGGYASVYASNFHSAFLAYPLHEPHGSVEAGLLCLSRFPVREAVRRSFPVDESFPAKFFDLDRCMAVLRLPVDGGGELVLVNLHMSAYDEGGRIRARQMDMLNGLLAAERAAGNWVVAGGDFNHALSGTVEAFTGGQRVPEWIAVFDEEALAEGYSVVRAANIGDTATCRSTDMPYQKGVNYEVTVDGFIVSDNVAAEAEIADTGFEFSDHNPVLLRFSLL